MSPCLLCLDFAILLDVDVLVGLESTDFVFGEFNAVEGISMNLRDIADG